MTNKQIGTEFERDFCELLAKSGFWVHFITPDRRGAQPFDVIAVRNGNAFAIDCKTLTDKRASISISRLEENQIMAFEKWRKCGNRGTWLAIKHGEEVYMLSYTFLKRAKTVKMEDCIPVERWLQ